MALTETYKEKMDASEVRGYRRRVFLDPLLAFMESADQTLVYKCIDKNEKTNCSTSVKQYIRNHDLNMVVWTKKNDVYVIKA